MKRLFHSLWFCLLWASLATAQGTLPIVTTQQFSFSGCVSSPGVACGQPLNGGLLYFYQVGTVATPQNSFQDTALTIPNPFPLVLDANGRVPPFYLANGTVHVRLTDANGVVQFDYPNMLVIGSSSGGGGGSSIDPTTVSATGDVKWRFTSETLVGWVKANSLTIGSATSGATGRANADTQALFTYLWINCPDAHCPVVGGRGASGLADFTANKAITTPDFRARMPAGLDDMGATAAGRLLASNVTSGGGDSVTTPNATGGESNHTLLAGEIPLHTHAVTDPGHAHTLGNTALLAPASGVTVTETVGTGNSTGSATTGITIPVTSGGASPPGGAAHNNMNPFMLGTWYVKL